MKRKSVKQIVKRILEINRELESMKFLYRELDVLTEELLQTDFKEGHGAKLVDNFSSKNTAFKATAIKRFDVVPAHEIFKIRRRRAA